MTELERMLAERACERLCLDYAFHADKGDMATLAKLFTEDGELVLPQGTSRGHAEIGRAPPPNPRLVMRHVNTNLRIEVDGPDSAKGTAYIALYAALRDGETGAAKAKLVAPRMIGAYVDTFVRTPDGWRFKQRAFDAALELAS